MDLRLSIIVASFEVTRQGSVALAPPELAITIMLAWSVVQSCIQAKTCYARDRQAETGHGMRKMGRNTD